MHIPSEFIRPFPAPESVFSADVEKHAQLFLPICSLNLRFIRPENGDFWLHFVQPADIYEGCIGETTAPFHDRYNFEDSICFDVDESGKYRFSSDWRFFDAENEYPTEIMSKAREKMEKYRISLQQALPYPYNQKDLDELREARRENQISYRLVKAFYMKHGRLPLVYFHNLEYSSQPFQAAFSALEQQDKDKQKQYHGAVPRKTELLQDAGGLSEDFQEWIKEDGVENVNALFQNGVGNLSDPPLRSDNRVFDYIGWFSGHNFQEYACDELYLFYDADSQKAVLRLVYS